VEAHQSIIAQFDKKLPKTTSPNFWIVRKSLLEKDLRRLGPLFSGDLQGDDERLASRGGRACQRPAHDVE
jgi:hypothetical protein